MWNLPAPPGFQGLRSDKPLTVYVRHLPHWRQEGATYFVTFRLHDSLPQSRLAELEQLRREWERQHGNVGRIGNPSCKEAHDTMRRVDVGRIGNPSYKEALERLAHETMRRVEHWLDQGMGSCRLKEPAVAKIVVDALHHFDGERYQLGCYVVMPNHVHAIVRPLECDTDPLERILQSRKRQTSHEINRLLGLSGTLWQEESFDRIIRDEEHLYRVIQYIGSNPGRAGLVHGQCPLWIRPEWTQCGWRFEAEM